MTKPQVRAPEKAQTFLRLARHAAGPAVPVELNLDSWLEPKDDLAWWIPVPAPFEVEDGVRLVGSTELRPGSGFDPRDVPWLASDFAELAAESVEGVRDFADRYGVTGLWTEREPGGPLDPPRERHSDAMLREATEIRQVLRALRYLEPFRNGNTYRLEQGSGASRASVSLGIWRDFLARVRMPELAPGLSLTGTGRSDLGHATEMGAGYWPPLDLLDVIRLQLLSDWLAARQVRECPFRYADDEPCGKLFVWPEKSEKSRLKGWGHPPLYCSPRHASAAAQQRRRAKKRTGAAVDTRGE